ncbi:MAG: hypothetical protein RLZZ474_1669 [Bacteroidota bacterium]
MEAKSIQLYQLAHKKLHLVEKDAMEFVELIHENIQDQTKDLVTKDYLDVQLMELKLELLTKIAETEKKIAETEKKILRWMFTFWIGQLAVMVGFLYLFVKH